MLVFLIKSSLSFILIYILYKLLLSNEKMHLFKRFYLLTGIILSLAFSIIKLNINIPINNLATPEFSSNPFIFQWYVLAVYFATVLVLTVRFVYNILCITKQQRLNESTQYYGYKLVLVNTQTLPYSFLNSVYVNKNDYQNGTIAKEIILHELAHVKQKHSVDIVLIELVKIMFWFNPAVWLLKKEMKLNHEYLADYAVVNAGVERYVFQNQLLNVVSGFRTSYLTSNYSYSLTKKRLKMLAKEISPLKQKLKLLIIIANVVLIGIILTGSQNAIHAKTINSGEAFETIIGGAELPDFQFNYSFIDLKGSGQQTYDECNNTYSE